MAFEETVLLNIRRVYSKDEGVLLAFAEIDRLKTALKDLCIENGQLKSEIQHLQHSPPSIKQHPEYKELKKQLNTKRKDYNTLYKNYEELMSKYLKLIQ